MPKTRPMSPQPQAIAHYRITAKLGEGKMGEVWRAIDGRLGREVAVKILPEGVARDAQRMARFEREVKVQALLNHPYIAQINRVEHRALLVEFGAGEPPKGPMPFDEVGKVALQITEAEVQSLLCFAHTHLLDSPALRGTGESNTRL